jgi:catechol 2,3-dioxygenase-like lactoylglutathione lyase family enzyme
VPHENRDATTRRQLLGLTGACAATWLGTRRAPAAELPLHTTGLEHLGLTVPDVEKSANLYGRIFDPGIYKEKTGPLRCYVKLGVGYIAVGGNATAPPKIDHVCALVENLEAAGVKTAAAGMVTDPDGFRLQLLAAPGGLAKTTEPAARIGDGPSLVTPVGFDHILLIVADLDRTAAFYRSFFGMESERTRTRVWFNAAATRLGLEVATTAKQPGVDHFCVKVKGLDRNTPEKLKALGASIEPSGDESLPGPGSRTLRFRDTDGIMVELKS